MPIESLIVGPLQVCCYIYYDEITKEGVIIDPGDEDPKILQLVETLKLKIQYLLGTHGHPDHILGVEYLRKYFNVPFLLHKEDHKFFQNPENFLTFKLWGFPTNPKADLSLEDGQILKIGNTYLQVIHTPGHSPGSVCFWNKEEKILFTGDTLFVQGVGRADLPGGSYKVMMHSIKEKILTLPKETRIYPGHDYGPKPISTLEEEIKFNPFLQED